MKEPQQTKILHESPVTSHQSQVLTASWFI